MATSRWTEGLLDEASQQGDNPNVHPNADELATGVMSHEGGVHRYNHLLEVADALLASPSLALTKASALRRHLEEFSPEALEYFEPAPAPPWVDEARLRMAGALWEENSVAAIAALYALSSALHLPLQEGDGHIEAADLPLAFRGRAQARHLSCPVQTRPRFSHLNAY